MKRHTQKQQPASGNPEHSSGAHSELARSAETAAALLELAISESLQPVEALGQALSRIVRSESSAEPPSAEDVAACIECLQFHDRMIQQLTQVRDLLSSAVASAPICADPPHWPALRETLRSRFTSESHRILFNLLMPDEVGHGRVQLHADEGSVELF